MSDHTTLNKKSGTDSQKFQGSTPSPTDTPASRNNLLSMNRILANPKRGRVSPDAILQLQRLIGNRAVIQFVSHSSPTTQRRTDDDCEDCGKDTVSEPPLMLQRQTGDCEDCGEDTVSEPPLMLQRQREDCEDCDEETLQRQSLSGQHYVQRGDNDNKDTSWTDKKARWVINNTLDVGDGLYVEGNLGITPVIPIHIAEGRKVYIQRVDPDTIAVEYHLQGQLGLDTGVGVGVGIKGRKGTGGIGAEAGAQAQAGVKAKVIQKYRIPISKLDDAMMNIATGMIPGGQPGLDLGPLGALSGGRGIELIFNSFEGHFEKFETDRKVEFSGFAQADAEAYISLAEVKGDKALDYRKYDRTGKHDKPFSPPENLAIQFYNNYLKPSLMAGASVQANVGYDDKPPIVKDGVTTREFKIYFEGEGALSLPIVNMVPGLSNIQLGGGVAFNITLTADAEGNVKPAAITVEVYTKHGDLDAYDISAFQNTARFDLGSLVTPEQFQALLRGEGPDWKQMLTSTNLKKAFTGLTLRHRYNLGYTSTRFSGFVRRHSSTRMLLGDRLTKGVDLDFYLTVTYDVSPSDALELIEIAGKAIKAGSGQAIKAATKDENVDFGAGFEALKSYLTDFQQTEDFAKLEEIILDRVSITEAAARFQAGFGAGIEGSIAAELKARIGGYAAAGMFCETDLAQSFGGKVNVRSMLQHLGEFFDDPRKFMPDCSLLDILYQGQGGKGGSGQGDAEGTSDKPGDKSNGTAAAGGEKETQAKGSGKSGKQKEGQKNKGQEGGKNQGIGGEMGLGSNAERYEFPAAEMDKKPEALNNYTAQVLAVHPVDVKEGRWKMDILSEFNGIEFHSTGIHIKRIEEDKTTGEVVFKPEKNYRIADIEDLWVTTDHEYRISKQMLDEALKSQKKKK